MKFHLCRKAAALVPLVLALVATSCSDGPEAAPGEAAGAKPAPPAAAPAQADGFDFSRPASVTRLPEELTEISGIAYVGENTVAAVQDEAGTLFLVDPASGQIRQEIRFGKKGDYEDLALVGGSLFVLRSDGRLYELKEGWRDGAAEAEEHETDLHKKCDAEGLSVETSGRLLISCKEDPGGDLKDTRTIFAYDVESGRLNPEPAYVIRFDALERVAGSNAEKMKDFKPSAIAVHPETQALFVLSSVKRSIAVLDSSGRVTAFHDLPGDIYTQPEGMAFLPGGGLLISNEGAGGTATMLRFN